MRNFYYILKSLGVKFNFIYTRDLFLAQERNQTLWGMKKLLEHYGIKVTAVKSATRSLDDVTYPFVCQLSQEGLVAITHEPKDLEEFIEQWNGYALLCDVSHAKEPHYYRHKLKEKIEYALPWITLASVVLTALCFLFDGFSLSTLLLTCFNLLGFTSHIHSAGVVGLRPCYKIKMLPIHIPAGCDTITKAVFFTLLQSLNAKRLFHFNPDDQRKIRDQSIAPVHKRTGYDDVFGVFDIPLHQRNSLLPRALAREFGVCRHPKIIIRIHKRISQFLTYLLAQGCRPRTRCAKNMNDVFHVTTP